MDNCVTIRHVFIMERLALMTHQFVLCIGVVHCSGAVVYSMRVYVHHPWGYKECILCTCVKSCVCPHGPLVGENARAVFCSPSVTGLNPSTLPPTCLEVVVTVSNTQDTLLTHPLLTLTLTCLLCG